MYSLIQRDIHAKQTNSSPGSTSSNDELRVPSVFTDPGYNLLGTSVLSTSNCGNPALRLFGFGPVTPEGYGIGGSPLFLSDLIPPLPF
jgi:carnitine O-acetyltransferase